jgi:hypothetical protein
MRCQTRASVTKKSKSFDFFVTLARVHCKRGIRPFIATSFELLLEFPSHPPRTVDELRVIRFWLRELSRMHCTKAEYFASKTNTNTVFLNPAFVEALFPNENIFLSLGRFRLFYPYPAMLSGIATLARIQTLYSSLADRDSLTTLFNELLLVNKNGIRRAQFLCDWWSGSINAFIKVQNIFLLLILVEMQTGILFLNFQLLSECGCAQLKRLPTEMKFYRYLSLDKYLSSDPLLKHIATTDEDGRDKYELLEQDAGRFGSMKVFLTSSGFLITVRITDDGLNNKGI